MTLPTPYYSRDGITIYCGDAREILPALGSADVVITDPVWPNAVASLAGADDPLGLFTEVASHFPAITKRLVVHLGCDSDPRFLAGVPAELPFLRACWLEYARPTYKGRILYGNDVAYVFGEPPPAQKGMSLMPGKMMQTESSRRIPGHPCPRRLQHVKWLVKWFARGLIVDPFVGSGTTLVAARDMGLPAIGIDVEERFCEISVSRLQQSVMQFDEPATRATLDMEVA